MRKKLLHIINQDLPVCSEPFLKLAGSKRGAKSLIENIKKLKRKKIIRNYNAKIDQRKTGFINNAMVVWNVSGENADKHAGIMVKHPEVSHCYLREARKEFPYNLYTMIHAKTPQKLNKIIDGISRHTNLKDFLVLKTLKQLKRSKQPL